MELPVASTDFSSQDALALANEANVAELMRRAPSSLLLCTTKHRTGDELPPTRPRR